MRTPRRKIKWEPVCVMLGIVVLASALVGFFFLMRYLLYFASPEERIASIQKERWTESCVERISEQSPRMLIVCEYAAESMFSIHPKH